MLKVVKFSLYILTLLFFLLGGIIYWTIGMESVRFSTIILLIITSLIVYKEFAPSKLFINSIKKERVYSWYEE